MNILTKKVYKTTITTEKNNLLWKGEEKIEECDNDTRPDKLSNV